MKNKANKKQLLEMLFLQTIGPLLVVIGHTMNGLPSNETFQALKKFIYVFHMPLFFFMAGYLFIYTNENSNIKYNEFIKKKFYRLLIPYFVWNIIFIVPKFLFQSYLSDKVVLSFKDIILLFFTPRLNIWGHLWFLVAIFIVYLISPIFKKLIVQYKKVYIIIFIIFFIFSCFPINTDLFTLADLSKNIIFFLLGMLAFKHIDLLKKPYSMITLAIHFVISFILWIIFDNRITTVLLCCNILLILLAIGFLIRNKIDNNIISNNSMTFYLFHWPIMIVTRIICYQLMHINYLISAIIMLLSGIIGPIIIIKIIEKLKLKEKSNVIKNIIGG